MWQRQQQRQAEEGLRDSLGPGVCLHLCLLFLATGPCPEFWADSQETRTHQGQESPSVSLSETEG